MTIEKLLIKIENNEIENGAMFCGGDLLYDLIVIDRDLYVINTITKTIVPLTSRTIGNFLEKKYKLYEYKQVID